MRYQALIFDFDGTIADTLQAGISIYNNIAAENGFIYAKKDKEKIAKSMYAGQVIRAEEMAKEFLNQMPVADKLG